MTRLYILHNMNIMNFTSYSPGTIKEGLTSMNSLDSSTDALPDMAIGKEFPTKVTFIKMEQLVHTEECVAAGCPEGFW
jgi:hypothetical protein